VRSAVVCGFQTYPTTARVLCTLSDCCFPRAVAADFLEQIKILQQFVSISDSESLLSLSLGIISSGPFTLSTANSEHVTGG